MSGHAAGATLSAAPQGRSQLLYWINGLCNSDYPAVESLRDGAAYCTILEAAVNRIAENCQTVRAKDASAASQRAQRASTIVARLDWSATSHVCSDVDPTLDSIVVSASCRKNMEVLLEMTTHCIPPDHARSFDVERMARGRFQDHIQFLQWLYQFMAKVLSTYSKSALQEAMTAPSGVEGVKLNRTMRMRQRTASARSSSASDIRARLREDRPVGTSVPAHHATRDTVRDSHIHGDRQYEHEDTVVMDKQESIPDERAHTSTPTPPVSAPTRDSRRGATPSTASAAGSPAAAPVFWDRGASTVPAALKPMLLELRREVEQTEALVLYVCETYQRNLTHNGSTPNAVATAPSELVCTCLTREPALMPVPAPTVSLSELGLLLDERDNLAHLYERIHLLLVQCEQRYNTSPLLRELRMLFQPTSGPLPSEAQ